MKKLTSKDNEGDVCMGMVTRKRKSSPVSRDSTLKGNVNQTITRSGHKYAKREHPLVNAGDAFSASTDKCENHLNTSNRSSCASTDKCENHVNTSRMSSSTDTDKCENHVNSSLNSSSTVPGTDKSKYYVNSSLRSSSASKNHRHTSLRSSGEDIYKSENHVKTSLRSCTVQGKSGNRVNAFIKSSSTGNDTFKNDVNTSLGSSAASTEKSENHVNTSLRSIRSSKPRYTVEQNIDGTASSRKKEECWASKPYSKRELTEFHCNICNGVFTRNHDLKRHLMKIHGLLDVDAHKMLNSRHSLDVDTSITEDRIVNAHITEDSTSLTERRISTVKVLSCTHCPHRSTRSHDMKKHLQRVHKLSDAEIQEVIQSIQSPCGRRVIKKQESQDASDLPNACSIGALPTCSQENKELAQSNMSETFVPEQQIKERKLNKFREGGIHRQSSRSAKKPWECALCSKSYFHRKDAVRHLVQYHNLKREEAHKEILCKELLKFKKINPYVCRVDIYELNDESMDKCHSAFKKADNSSLCSSNGVNEIRIDSLATPANNGGFTMSGDPILPLNNGGSGMSGGSILPLKSGGSGISGGSILPLNNGGNELSDDSFLTSIKVGLVMSCDSIVTTSEKRSDIRNDLHSPANMERIEVGDDSVYCSPTDTKGNIIDNKDKIELNENSDLCWMCVICNQTKSWKKVIYRHLNQVHGITGRWVKFFVRGVNMQHQEKQIIVKDEVNLERNFLCTLCGGDYTLKKFAHQHFNLCHSDVADDQMDKVVIDKLSGSKIIVVSLTNGKQKFFSIDHSGRISQSDVSCLQGLDRKTSVVSNVSSDKANIYDTEDEAEFTESIEDNSGDDKHHIIESSNTDGDIVLHSSDKQCVSNELQNIVIMDANPALTTNEADTDDNEATLKDQCTLTNSKSYKRMSYPNSEIPWRHSRRHMCKICSSVYTSREQLLKHMKHLHSTSSVRNIPRWKCLQCSNKFKTCRALLEHVVSVHKVIGDNCLNIMLDCKYPQHKSGEIPIDIEINNSENSTQESFVNEIEPTRNEDTLSEQEKLSVKSRAVESQSDNCHDVYQQVKAVEDHEAYGKKITKGNRAPLSATSTTSRLTYQITCPYCEHDMSSYTDLIPHMKEEHAINIKKCQECQHYFINTTVLKDHVLTEHSTHQGYVKSVCKTLTCAVCDKDFTSRLTFDNHMVTHNKDKVTCYVCDERFASVLRLKFHMSRCHSLRRSFYCCVICERNVEDLKGEIERHVTSHYYRHHGPYTCTTCGKLFSNVHTLEQHGRFHKRSLVCSYCGKTFGTPLGLRSHIISHEDPNRFRCDICGKVMSTATHLKEHLALHSGDKKCVCDICGKLLNSNKYLKVHLKLIHNDRTASQQERPGALQRNRKVSPVRYVQRHQSKNFKSAVTNLKKSKITRKADDLGKRSCPICQKVFSQPNLARAHMARHTKARTYKCRYCDKTYGYKSQQYDHQRRIHPDQHKYDCGCCDTSFNKYRLYQQHMLNCHNDLLPKKHYCVPCDKHYFSDVGLKVHNDELHPDSRSGDDIINLRYFCTLCNRGFLFKKGVVSHIKHKHPGTDHKCWDLVIDATVTEENKVYQCAVCSQLFNNLRAVNQHLCVEHVTNNNSENTGETTLSDSTREVSMTGSTEEITFPDSTGEEIVTESERGITLSNSTGDALIMTESTGEVALAGSTGEVIVSESSRELTLSGRSGEVIMKEHTRELLSNRAAGEVFFIGSAEEVTQFDITIQNDGEASLSNNTKEASLYDLGKLSPTCRICNARFTTAEDVTTHHNNTHGLISQSTSPVVGNDGEKVTENYLYTCRICGKGFNHIRAHNYHFNKVHSNRSNKSKNALDVIKSGTQLERSELTSFQVTTTSENVCHTVDTNAVSSVVVISAIGWSPKDSCDAVSSSKLGASLVRTEISVGSPIDSVNVANTIKLGVSPSRPEINVGSPLGIANVFNNDKFGASSAETEMNVGSPIDSTNVVNNDKLEASTTESEFNVGFPIDSTNHVSSDKFGASPAEIEINVGSPSDSTNDVSSDKFGASPADTEMNLVSSIDSTKDVSSENVDESPAVSEINSNAKNYCTIIYQGKTMGKSEQGTTGNTFILEQGAAEEILRHLEQNSVLSINDETIM